MTSILQRKEFFCLTLLTIACSVGQLHSATISYKDIEHQRETILASFYEKGYCIIRDVPGQAERRKEYLNAFKSFIELPQKEKLKYKTPECYISGYSVGEESYNGEEADDYKESFYFPHPMHKDTSNTAFKWPSQVLQEAASNLAANMHEVILKVARCTSLIDLNMLEEVAIARALHYKKIPNRQEKVTHWTAPHRDHGFLTALIKDAYLKDGVWVSKGASDTGLCIQGKHIKGMNDSCVVVQVGESAEIITGSVKATLHWVTGKPGTPYTRITMALFVNPKEQLKIYAPNKVDTIKFKNRYEPGISFGEFARRTFESYYSKRRSKL
ncbi:MAG: 2-oxoglutarate and iron-dependent oxygenase domain-containing protein [Bacteroidota bacterium]